MGLKLTYLGLKLKEKTINTNFEKKKKHSSP